MNTQFSMLCLTNINLFQRQIKVYTLKFILIINLLEASQKLKILRHWEKVTEICTKRKIKREWSWIGYRCTCDMKLFEFDLLTHVKALIFLPWDYPFGFVKKQTSQPLSIRVLPFDSRKGWIRQMIHLVAIFKIWRSKKSNLPQIQWPKI